MNQNLNQPVSASFNIKGFESEIFGQISFLIGVHFKALCGNKLFPQRALK
jgi:hypothetical protein